MKRKEKIIYNGQTIYWKSCSLTTIKMCIRQPVKPPNEARKKKNEYKSVLNVSMKAKKRKNIS